jgi:lipopolysaccharide transport system permease protein
VTYIEPPSPWSVRLWSELRVLLGSADLLRTLSAHRINVRYKRSRLGILWAMLQPLSMMVVFTLVFGLLGGAPTPGVPYPLFAYSGLLLWSAFSGGLSSATTALTAHASLVTRVHFPREILPLTYVAVALADLLIGGILLVALMARYGIAITPLAVWALVAIALLTLWLIGSGLLLSALNVKYRDLGLALPVVLQVWMFASPVLYPLSAARRALSDHTYTLYIVNPMAGIVDTFRRVLVLNEQPDLRALGVSAAVTLVLLPAAYVYFKVTERTVADVV